MAWELHLLRLLSLFSLICFELLWPFSVANSSRVLCLPSDSYGSMWRGISQHPFWQDIPSDEAWVIKPGGGQLVNNSHNMWTENWVIILLGKVEVLVPKEGHRKTQVNHFQNHLNICMSYIYLNILYLIMCICVRLSMCTYISEGALEEQERAWILQSWSYGWLWAIQHGC